jgi:hypothetical protein
MNPNKASLMLNKELSKLQKQMKDEIDKVLKEHQEQAMPNARVLISLAFYADTFVKHLEEREQTEATEALIKEYKTFRMSLNLHEV